MSRSIWAFNLFHSVLSLVLLAGNFVGWPFAPQFAPVLFALLSLSPVRTQLHSARIAVSLDNLPPNKPLQPTARGLPRLGARRPLPGRDTVYTGPQLSGRFVGGRVQEVPAGESYRAHH